MMTNYAEPSTLTVWGAVWRDNETDLTREAVHLDQIELEGPVSKKAIVKTLVQLDRQLKAGAEVFSGNSEAFEIAKTPLVKL